MSRYVMVPALAFSLGACGTLGGLVEDNLPKAASAVADALQTYCAAPVEERKKLHAAIVANYAKNGINIAVPVFDCDNDEKPDFLPQ